MKALKISYSCVYNVEKIISSHNSKLLNKLQWSEVQDINPAMQAECPVDGKCMSKNVVYETTIFPPKKCKSKEDLHLNICRKLETTPI